MRMTEQQRDEVNRLYRAWETARSELLKARSTVKDLRDKNATPATIAAAVRTLKDASQAQREALQMLRKFLAKVSDDLPPDQGE